MVLEFLSGGDTTIHIVMAIVLECCKKFSRRGSVFKTYEGELILSSVRGNANVPIASEKFYFSVTDDRVAQKLNNLQGRGITVHYKEKNSSAFWRGDSPYIVDSVRAE